MICTAPSSTETLSARTSSGLPSLSPVPSCPLRRKWVATSWSMISGVTSIAGPVTRQLVAGQLLADDLVERLVGVERPDRRSRDSDRPGADRCRR